MRSQKTWQVIGRIYHNANTATWALVWALVLYFIVFIAPHISEIRAKMVSERILDISAENRFYCEKWGMHEGTENYLQCTFDLQQIRANVEQRIAADPFF